MARLKEIVDFVDNYLEVKKFEDYCPNGLQVQGADEVTKILTGVTASEALINGAINEGVDLIMVHHGYFWRGESQVIVGEKFKKIKLLIENNISLLAYHLPLDAHFIVGNNVQLAKKIGLLAQTTFGERKVPLVLACEFESPMSSQELVVLLEGVLGREVLHIGADKSRLIKKVAICTGGAQSYFSHAIEFGVDVYITGEASEKNYHMALESGVDFISAGHHATERYGVQALGDLVSQKFGVKMKYFELDNPI